MDKQQLSNLLHVQQASRENRLVIFVGAGISKNSGVPTWKELIMRMKSELPQSVASETDALKIAQLYKNSRGHKEYMDLVKRVLLYNKVVPNPLHKRILSLNPCNIITTNYDDLIEQEIRNEFLQFAIIREDEDIPRMTYPNTLIKMHGDFDKDNIVLTESDYFNYPQRFPLMRAFVQSLFASKLVLFVGFSFSDLNLKMILNELKNILSENMQRVYLLSCVEPDFVTKQYFEEKGITVLYFCENDIDIVNDGMYSAQSLRGAGLLIDKLMFAIKNYNEISTKDLASHLYSRIASYNEEIRSLGDGLKYFFLKDDGKIMWNTHSSGLQTSLDYFRNLEKTLKTSKDKRMFLAKHPVIQLRNLLEIAYYNYLGEIDGIEILDKKFYENIVHYIAPTAIDMLHDFNMNKICERLKSISSYPVKYNINDLEYPFTLYLIGDYWSAYCQYVKLLPLYWERQKYILYFICRYNIWSIRNAVRASKSGDKSFNIEKNLHLAYSTDFEDILNKLPLDKEIRKIFQDLISYKYIGTHVAETSNLKEEIYQQRKSAEKGGASINSNIERLIACYQREYLFCNSNYIICDNNNSFKSLCDNTALGILNSFATPETKLLGGVFETTRIESLDAFMLKMLIFDMDANRLGQILKGYEIKDLLLDESGISYVNRCLNGLVSSKQFLYRNSNAFLNSFCNLLLIISKTKTEGIDVVLLYNAILKYWDYEIYFKVPAIKQITERYKASKDSATQLITKMLYNSNRPQKYVNCIESLTSCITEFSDIRFDCLGGKDRIVNLLVLYTAFAKNYNDQVLRFCLDNVCNLAHYILFLFENNIVVSSSEKFIELKAKTKHIDIGSLRMLAQMRKNPVFDVLYTAIDEIADTNECLVFFLDPEKYHAPENVDIRWIFELDEEDERNLFKIDVYKRKLKDFINQKRLSQEDLKQLIGFL